MKKLWGWIKVLFRIEPRNEGRLELAIVRLALAFVLANGFLFDLRPTVDSWRGTLGDAVTDQSIRVLSDLNFFFRYQFDEQGHPSGMSAWWGAYNLWGLTDEPIISERFRDITFWGDPKNFGGGGTSPSEWPFLKMLFAVMLVLFCFGVSPVISWGYVTFVVIAVGSLRNSQGNIHHGSQIVAMTVFGHWLGYVWFALRNRQWSPALLFGGTVCQRTSFFAAQQMAAATYVVAGAIKLLRSGFDWFSESPNIAIQVLKIGYQHYYGDGKTDKLEHAERVAEVISTYPTITQLMLGAGLFAELLAFFALYNRKQGLIFGVSLIALHLFVGYLMALTFPLNIYILLVYFMPLPYALSRLMPRRTSAATGDQD